LNGCLLQQSETEAGSVLYIFSVVLGKIVMGGIAKFIWAVCTTVPNFVAIGQIVVRYDALYFSAWRPTVILDLLYTCSDRKFNIVRVRLENAYSRPKMGFWEILPSKLGIVSL